MIPLKLTLQGLYSYQQKVEIDFETLQNSKLFGIFGAVGSGKSTILEAISFSIYGETERLGRNEGRGYNMMNLKSNKLWIDFEFRAGKDEQIFRITTELKRKKRFKEIGVIQRHQYLKTENDWEPISLNEIHEAIGLNYNNFRRTIIIPQGKFQEFLQLKDKDRTQMLKEIFQLYRFELFGNVSRLNSKNKEKLQNIEGQLIQLQNVDEDELKNLNNQHKSLIEKVLILKKLVLDLEQKEKKQLKIKELNDDLSNLRANLVRLENEGEIFNAREQSLLKFENCVLVFKDQIENNEKALLALKEVQKNLEQRNSENTSLSKQLSLLQKELKEINNRRERRESDEQQIRDLESVLEVQKTLKKEKELWSRIEKGRAFIKEFEQTYLKEKQKSETLFNALAQKKKMVPNLEVITGIGNWNSKNIYLKEQLKKEIQDDRKARQKKAEIANEINLIRKQAGLNSSDLNLESLYLKNNRNLNVLINKKEEILIDLRLQGVNLEEGKPCPLCGTKSHPGCFNGKYTRDDLITIDQEIERNKKIITDFQEFKTRLKIAEKEILQLNEELENYRISIKKAEENLRLQKDKFLWKEWVDDLDLLTDKLEHWAVLNKEVLGGEMEALEKEKLLAAMDEKKVKYQKGVDDIALELKEVEGKKKVELSQIKVLKVDDCLNLKESDINKELSGLREYLTKLEKEFKQKEQLLDSCKTQKGKVEGIVSQLDLNEKSLKNEVSIISNKIVKNIEESSFNSIEEVKEILNSGINPEEERRAIEKYKAELGEKRFQIKQKEKLVNKQEFDPLKFEDLQLNLRSKKNELEETLGEKIKLGTEVERITKLVKEKEVLLKEKDKKEKRQENLKTLLQLFKGSGFVNYISSVYLKTLCQEANKRFQKLTKQSLKLEMSEDNQFYVRDYLNNGELRNIKTLSGGQMFQASLCMSLALAQQVQELSQVKQNFFFLDEGFGSLDKEALQLVFETLKSLRKENRVVGIISHVEELQQEIETYVKVNNHPETGSSVQFSWET